MGDDPKEAVQLQPGIFNESVGLGCSPVHIGRSLLNPTVCVRKPASRDAGLRPAVVVGPSNQGASGVLLAFRELVLYSLKGVPEYSSSRYFMRYTVKK